MAVIATPIEQLLSDLHSPDTFVRSSAARELGRSKDPRAVTALIPELKEKDWRARRNAAQALGSLRAPEAVEPLTAALKDRVMTVRARAAVALGRIKDPRAVPALIEALLAENDDWQVYDGCTQSLKKMGKACASAATAALTGAPALPAKQQLRLLTLLAGIPGAAVIEPLVVLAEDPDPNLRYQAVEALAQAKKDPRAVEVLRGALYDQSYMVRSAAAGALAKSADPRVAAALVDQLRDHELYGPRQEIYRAVTQAFQQMAGMAEQFSGPLSISPIGLAGALTSLGQEEHLKQMTGRLTDMYHNFAGLFGAQREIPPQMRKVEDMLFTMRNAGSIAIAQVDGLMRQLSAPDPITRMAAAVSLPWYGDARALRPLKAMSADLDPDTSQAAAWAAGALEKIFRDRGCQIE